MNKLNNEVLDMSSEKDNTDYKEFNLVKDNNTYILILKRTKNKIIFMKLNSN